MNAILTVSSILFPMISFPYVNRVLGPDGTGTVDFAASIIGYFSMVALMGIPTYGIRICAQVRDDKIKLSKTVHELMIINFVMTLFSYLIFLPALFLVPDMRTEKALFLIVSSTLWFNLIGIDYMYKALEEYSYITIRSIIFKLIALVTTFFLIKSKGDYVAYGFLSIFAASASNIFNFFHARKYISFKPRFGQYEIRKHLKPILLFFAMTCATQIYLNLDKAMIGFMTTKTDVGYYGAAIKIKTILVTLVTSLGTVLLPRASYYVEQNMMDEFRRITEKALKFVFVVATPLMAFFMLFATPSIMFVSGEEYLPAIPTMMIVMPTLVFIGITNILGIQILIPLGKEKYVLYSEIAGAIVDFVLNIFLIPILKADGAALGTTVAELVVLIVQCILLRKIRKEHPILGVFKKIKYWKIVVAIAVAIPCGIWARWLKFSFYGSFIKKASIRILLENVSIIAVGGILFFLGYYVIMMLLKDDMMKEITNTVFGKLKKMTGKK